jgi:hypothetical protein
LQHAQQTLLIDQTTALHLHILQLVAASTHLPDAVLEGAPKATSDCRFLANPLTIPPLCAGPALLDGADSAAALASTHVSSACVSLLLLQLLLLLLQVAQLPSSPRHCVLNGAHTADSAAAHTCSACLLLLLLLLQVERLSDVPARLGWRPHSSTGQHPALSFP